MMGRVGLNRQPRSLSGRVLPAFRALLVWMTLGLSTKFFPRARTPLADEACDLIRDLVCDVYSV
jgi:hypothetical protein